MNGITSAALLALSNAVVLRVQSHIEDIGLAHVASADQCPADTVFTVEACACFFPTEMQCADICALEDPERPVKNPFRECECIS